jgi:hypothetical protein
MKRQYLALGSCLALSLAVAGCQDQTTAPALAPSARTASTSELDAPALTFGLSGLVPSLTDEVSDVSIASPDRLINPNDYVCSASSPINDYVNAEINGTVAAHETTALIQLLNLAADQVPTYEALYFQSASTPQTYGYDGEFTQRMVKTERDVKKFWDIPSADIQVVAMHGNVLVDTARVAATYRYVYGLGAAQAAQFAAIVRNTILGSTTMNGNYSLWTFNAVSSTTKKIVMGDGILEGYKALGFDDVAPQAIFAHEFAHQIQFQKNYRVPTFGGTTPPERTRYTELMADAYAAYYLTHARGATLRQKRVEEFLEVFYQIGDCSFTSSGHHGTPNQRLAAARFGFSVADEFQKQGHILTAAEFFARFQAQYPTIIAPDAH